MKHQIQWQRQETSIQVKLPTIYVEMEILRGRQKIREQIHKNGTLFLSDDFITFIKHI